MRVVEAETTAFHGAMIEPASPSPARFQSTIGGAFEVEGRGLHTNAFARVRVEPAPPGTGLAVTVAGKGESRIDWRHRAPGRLNTPLALSDGGRLRMVEHLASALVAFRVDNARIIVEGDELPVADGSALPWTNGLREVGIVQQAEPRSYIRILRPFQIRLTAGFVRFEPSDVFELDVTGLGRPGHPAERWRGRPDPDAYLREIAPSRSNSDLIKVLTEFSIRNPVLRPLVLRLDARRLASRANEGINTPREDLPSTMPEEIYHRLAIDRPEPVLSRGARPGTMALMVGAWTIGGARFTDERVRHHVLDLMGDLALADGPILGRVVAHRPTHNLTFAAIASLMTSPDAWDRYVPG